jgi:ABC-type uncharacterized transport system permease subunit
MRLETSRVSFLMCPSCVPAVVAPSEKTSLVGAYFFGALQALAPQLQAREIHLGPTELWTNSLPYLITIVVLVLASSSGGRRRLGAPASLPYVREER